MAVAEQDQQTFRDYISDFETKNQNVSSLGGTFLVGNNVMGKKLSLGQDDLLGDY